MNEALPPSLAGEMDRVVSTFGKEHNIRRIKQEVTYAWERVYPKTPGTEYQQYVKDNIGSVREEYPDKTHTEHMKIVGAMWTLSRPRLTGKKRTSME
jgi:hypothetical protein